MYFWLFLKDFAARICKAITLNTNKGAIMDIFALFEQLKATITDLQLKLADTDAAIVEAKKAAYDEGFAAGVASVVIPPSDKIFSQEELDAAVMAAVAPVQASLDEALVKIADLETKVGEIDMKVAEAVAAMKADLLVKYEEQQVAESVGEVGFADLLK